MADIELVIKLPEKVINRILEYKEMPYTDLVIEAIYHGVQLPKGHGRLKDVDAVMRELSVVSSRPVKSQMYMIEHAPTIIEADTESEK